MRVGGGREQRWTKGVAPCPHTLVNTFPTGVKILDRPNWSLDRVLKQLLTT